MGILLRSKEHILWWKGEYHQVSSHVKRILEWTQQFLCSAENLFLKVYSNCSTPGNVFSARGPYSVCRIKPVSRPNAVLSQ